jgi:hypothetical protein
MVNLTARRPGRVEPRSTAAQYRDMVPCVRMGLIALRALDMHAKGETEYDAVARLYARSDGGVGLRPGNYLSAQPSVSDQQARISLVQSKPRYADTAVPLQAPAAVGDRPVPDKCVPSERKTDPEKLS